MDKKISVKVEKVTFFLATLKGGGIQKATLRLLREFSRRGIKTTLVVANGEGPVRRQVRAETNLIDLRCRRIRNAVIPLIKHLVKEKPQIGVSSQTHLNVLMIILRILSGFPKQLIVREHNTFVEENVRQGSFLERIRPKLIRFFYPFASRFIAVSASAKQSIVKYARYKKEIQVIPNGLDLDEIWKQKNQSFANPWESHYREKKLIVALGRLSKQKNLSLLLNAFALIDDEDTHLLIIGEGEELDQLRELSRKLQVNEKVDFTGFIENPYPILSQAKVFVLSSKWEGFCNVVIEALACGVPVVATDCPGGPADILNEMPFARIVPLDEPGAMATGIKELLNEAVKRDQIVEYSKRFDVKDVAQHYIELFTEMR